MKLVISLCGEFALTSKIFNEVCEILNEYNYSVDYTDVECTDDGDALFTVSCGDNGVRTIEIDDDETA